MVPNFGDDDTQIREAAAGQSSPSKGEKGGREGEKKRGGGKEKGRGKRKGEGEGNFFSLPA